MSDELPLKQYILMVDHINMLLIGKVLPGIQFLEVQGMNVQGNDALQVLTTPIVKNMPTTDVATAADQEALPTMDRDGAPIAPLEAD